MKIFLDTADTAEIRRLAPLGVIDGVTTNPTLIKKSGRRLKEVIMEIRDILPEGDISVEVFATDTEGMLKEAKEYLQWDRDLTIKIPMTAEGLKATRLLSEKGVFINMTLVFSVSQALLAAKAGATYVSPFIGRLDDISADGLGLIEEIRTTFDHYTYETEILAASLRSAEHFHQCALLGADICTIPSPLLEKLLSHPLTDIGLAQFVEDAKSITM